MTSLLTYEQEQAKRVSEWMEQGKTKQEEKEG
jgi:hypothetical protein